MTKINENKQQKFEVIKGMVRTIYEDFDTGEPIIKDRAVAFLLEIDKDDSDNRKEEIIVVYDKNAVKFRMITVGKPLTCLGEYNGTVTGRDSKGIIVEKQRFLCMGIMGNANITEKQLIKEGAIKWTDYEKILKR